MEKLKSLMKLLEEELNLITPRKNTLSYVGVNNGNDGVFVQIYSKDKATNKGSRLNAAPEGIFYTSGKTNASYEAADEIVTKRDLTEAIEAVDHTTYATKRTSSKRS